MYLIVYEKPITLQHTVKVKGLPPLDVLIIVKYAKHDLVPLNQWGTLVEKHITIDKQIMNIPVSIELLTLSREDFDVWYLEIFTTVTDRLKNTVRHRSGPFGLSLGGIPPTIWAPKIAISDKIFIGEPPREIEFVKAELGPVFIGVKPQIDPPLVELSPQVQVGQPPQIGKPIVEIKK